MGYVGCVSAACLAANGHKVIGVDNNSEKVSAINLGHSTIVEDQIEELTTNAVEHGLLSATVDSLSAVLSSEISLICVGTPSAISGKLSTQYLEQVSYEIGSALALKDEWHVVAFRSTMLPGTCEEILIPILESSSGKKSGIDFGVCVNPEYLREGTSVADYFNPPKIVVGATDKLASDSVLSLYEELSGERFIVPIKVAEMSKYIDNTFHALKVCFANEIGSICSALELDSHDVMDIFLADSKLNLSSAYLRPGLSFGGSCLPKDVRALSFFTQHFSLETPIISNVIRSNESHLLRVFNLILNDGRRRVGIFGLAFKSGTDDLRESPFVELAERLIGKGLSVKIFDPHVALSRLQGKNKDYISRHVPHISELLTDDSEEMISQSEIIVVGNRSPETLKALSKIDHNQLVIDLIRLPDIGNWRSRGNYRGVAW
jgi:GDP-mannose 6-dehydrogenase